VERRARADVTPTCGARTSVRIDLVRRERQHRPIGRLGHETFERREEELDVGDA
jgi:hypothetical protein